VRITGAAELPPLVLLHGARGNSLMWVPNIAALSARFRTYALDLIGETGLSVSGDRVTRCEQLLTWLDEVLAALAPEGEPVRLAGMSYGGWLASQYALTRPGRVRRLVLLSPAATVQSTSPAMLGRALLTLLRGFDFRRKFYHWLLRDAVESGPAGQAYVDQAVDDWELAERCFRELLLVPATVLRDDMLRAWQTPTLYLVGEHEKIYAAEKAMARLKRLAPQIQTQLFPGAGHDLWWVQAQAVTSAMLNFLTAERATSA
jgi:pimeloyl-ACP methyl ester carboxylesterase